MYKFLNHSTILILSVISIYCAIFYNSKALLIKMLRF